MSVFHASHRSFRAWLAPAVAAVALLGSTSLNAQVVQSFDPPAELVEAAQAEGRLVIYHGNPSAHTQHAADIFAETYGIEVELFHATSGPLSVRFANEASSGQVINDFLYTTDAAIWVDNPEWFEPLSAETIPNIARLTSADNLLPNAFGLYQGSFVLIYNTDKLSPDEVPTTWEALGDPKWKDEIIMPDPRSSASYIKIMAVLHELHPGLLERIGENNPHIVESSGPGAQQLAAGSRMVVVPALDGHALGLIESGAPIERITVQEPELTRNSWGGIPADAPHPNAARLFVNWFLSDEGIAAFCGFEGAAVRSVLDREGALGCDEVAGDPIYLDDRPPSEDVVAEVTRQLGLF